jgi:ribosomal protein L40E
MPAKKARNPATRKKRATKKKPPPKKPNSRVCDSCGAHNKLSATECKECGGKRFAPEWVEEMRRINRSFSVQVTRAHPLSGGDEPRLTLYKWWPGGRQNFNINTSDQWAEVKRIVELELGEFLGWKSADEIKADAETEGKNARKAEQQIKGLASQDPKFVTQVLKDLKLDKVSEEDLPKLSEAIGDLAEILMGVDEAQRTAIQKLVKQLPKQGKKAIEELSALMEELTAGQIAAVAGEVKRRVGLLNTFKDRVLDDRTYEITGDGSIHRLLERAMWIVDERYWLMHSNRQLRTIVTTQLAKEDKKFENKRPDFVCGTVDRKLIVIEIKRPSHTLEVEDLNQLERYVMLCQKYNTELSGYEAILVGQKESDNLTRTRKLRGGSQKVQTYTQLIDDTERRYGDYLKALEG